MKPKHLLFAPPLVWSAAGILLLVDGRNAVTYFPYLWFANDIAIMLAFAGIMMHLFAGPGTPGPKRDEWTDWDPTGESDLPLEEMLVQLAHQAEAESGPL